MFLSFCLLYDLSLVLWASLSTLLPFFPFRTTESWSLLLHWTTQLKEPPKHLVQTQVPPKYKKVQVSMESLWFLVFNNCSVNLNCQTNTEPLYRPACGLSGRFWRCSCARWWKWLFLSQRGAALRSLSQFHSELVTVLRSPEDVSVLDSSRPNGASAVRSGSDQPPFHVRNFMSIPTEIHQIWRGPRINFSLSLDRFVLIMCKKRLYFLSSILVG